MTRTPGARALASWIMIDPTPPAAPTISRVPALDAVRWSLWKSASYAVSVVRGSAAASAQSSEAGLLVTVERAIREKKPVVFLAWEPHPMNFQMKINYLSGGDDVFGPNYGEARVYTLKNSDLAES